MKASRLNLCQCVRESLILAGYSSVKVVDAVNSELAKATLVSEEAKTGDGKIKSKGLEYAVTVTGTYKYIQKNTLPVTFDAWHSAVAKAEKIASMDNVALPKLFIEWLDKFAKAELTPEQEEHAKGLAKALANTK
jgi:hypothetical protein